MKQAKEFINDYLFKHNVNKKEFMSRSRKRDLVFHRLIVSNVLRRVFDLGFDNCGKLINRDHSSVIYHVKEYDTLSEIYKDYKTAYDIASSFARSYLDKTDKHADIVHRLLVSNNVLRDNINNKKLEIDSLRIELLKVKRELKSIKQDYKELKYNYV